MRVLLLGALVVLASCTSNPADESARAAPMQVDPAVAPLAQVNPFGPGARGFQKLFSTHPPTEERVARLEAMVV